MAEDLTLNNGNKIPAVGLGTYKANNLEKVIEQSIDIGYRLIDTAFVYNNEVQIGLGLKTKLESGGIKREELFIVSKLWNTQHKPKDVIPVIKRSLSDLQLDYLDLYLMHWPYAWKATKNEYEICGEEDDVPFEDTWKAMEECVKFGYTKSIGLSNFNSVQIDRILKVATVRPVVNQVECNPYLNQKQLIEFCKQREILIMAYSPFYAPGRLNSEQHGLNIFEEPVINELSKKYKKTSSQIILRYLTQLGTVPIPKTDKYERLKENINIFNFTLSEEEIKTLDKLNKNLRCTVPKMAEKFKENPFAIEF